MAATIRLNSTVGHLYYIPEDTDALLEEAAESPQPLDTYRPRARRHNSVRVAALQDESIVPKQDETDTPSIARRLTAGRENAKRLLKSVSAPTDWSEVPRTAEEALILELLTGVNVRSTGRSSSPVSTTSSSIRRQSSSRHRRESEGSASSPLGLSRHSSSRNRRESEGSSSVPSSSRQSSFKSQKEIEDSLSSSHSPSSPSSPFPTPPSDSEMPPDMAASRRPFVMGESINSVLTRPSLSDNTRIASDTSNQSASSTNSDFPTMSRLRHDNNQPIASSNGVSVFVSLAEPVIYLQGFEQNDSSSRTTSMLRGSLLVRVTKPSKIKTISLKFRGKARTEWPEGIPPKKQDDHEEKSIITHGWPFFNAAFESAESGVGADIFRPLKDSSVAVGSSKQTNTSGTGVDQFQQSLAPSSIDSHKNNKEHRRSLQMAPTRGFGKSESGSNNSIASKGYRTFQPGDYIYNFEYPIDCHLPETINTELGHVDYKLEAMIERSGAFRANIMGSKEVTMVRVPGEASLEQVEPIAISRSWEDQLHYDIVISGKSFPLGSQIPIAFKLTPLAKVQCHRIKVYVTENIEYFCSNKRVHRMEPTRKIQLLEKRAELPSTSTYAGSSVRIISGGGVPFEKRDVAASGTETTNPQSTNLLGDLDSDHNVGPTEIEMSVQLPSCTDLKSNQKAQRIHFDTTYSNIQVHHWIKIVMRLSKPDPADSSRRRHFEISIDSPLHILSCQATQANTALPAYSDGAPPAVSNSTATCGCPGSRRRDPPSLNSPGSESFNSRSLPPAAHLHNQLNGVQRPIHLLRNPSFNPPPFDADTMPPLMSPPPQYESIVNDGEGLADYFSRLADSVADEEDDEEGEGAPRRIDHPLSPGGRINRSMDEQRTWGSLEA